MPDSPTADELWQRFLAELERRGVNPGHAHKRDFLAGLAVAEQIAERQLAFVRVHQDLQKIYLDTKVENVALKRRISELEHALTEVTAEGQRLLTWFGDPEDI